MSLIPVEPIATGNLDFDGLLERGRLLAPALAREMRENLLFRQLADQAHAHALDVRAANTGLQEHVTDDRVQAGAILFALATLVLRRVEVRCAHISWPFNPAGPRVIVSLSARAAICTDDLGCLSAVYRHWQDDGLCEACGKPSSVFWPHVVPMGPAVVSLETCPDCHQKITPGDAS